LSDRNSEESASGADRAGASHADHWAAKAAPLNDAGRDDYEVGYGRPPKATRFQPGKSGNPAGGRKRKAPDKGLSDQLNELLAETVTVNIGGRRKRMSSRELLLRRIISDAQKSNGQTRKLVLDLIKDSDARDRAAASIYTNPNGKVHEFNWDEAKERLYQRLEEAVRKQNEE
jgi:hypothetical protein